MRKEISQQLSNLNLNDAGAILISHGSSENPRSSESARYAAHILRESEIFAEVRSAFWKEETNICQFPQSMNAQKIYVAPNFIAEGFFTRVVILTELGIMLDYQTALREPFKIADKELFYCEPIGVLPETDKMLLQRLHLTANLPPNVDCELVLVGHGARNNKNSRKLYEKKLVNFRNMQTPFTRIHLSFMEENPLISDWHTFTDAEHIVICPIFIADSEHSYVDIPNMIGIKSSQQQADLFQKNPRELLGRKLYFIPSLSDNYNITPLPKSPLRKYLLAKFTQKHPNLSKEIMTKINAASQIAELLLLTISRRSKLAKQISQTN